MIINHLDTIGKQLNILCEKYENFILMGDFNSEMCEDIMQEFCNTYKSNKGTDMFQKHWEPHLLWSYSHK